MGESADCYHRPPRTDWLTVIGPCLQSLFPHGSDLTWRWALNCREDVRTCTTCTADENVVRIPRKLPPFPDAPTNTLQNWDRHSSWCSEPGAKVHFEL